MLMDIVCIFTESRLYAAMASGNIHEVEGHSGDLPTVYSCAPQPEWWWKSFRPTVYVWLTMSPSDSPAICATGFKFPSNALDLHLYPTLLSPSRFYSALWKAQCHAPRTVCPIASLPMAPPPLSPRFFDFGRTVRCPYRIWNVFQVLFSYDAPIVSSLFLLGCQGQLQDP